MPKRSNDFQTLIKTIYEQIVPEGGKVTESGMVYDNEAGDLREVDILIEYRYAGHNFSFIIECRDRSRSESIEWIDALIGKSKSLNVNKVIAVSSKGFTRSAIKKARENAIETLTLRQAQETDWVNIPVRPGIVVMTGDVYHIKDVYYLHDGEYLDINKLGLDSDVEYDGYIIGNLRDLIVSFFRELLAPRIDDYKKENFPNIFRTVEDLDRDLVIESEHDWPLISVLTISGERVEVSRVKFIVVGTRKSTQIEEEHHLFNQKMVSTGTYHDTDGSFINFSIVQDPETRKLNARWWRTNIDNVG